MDRRLVRPRRRCDLPLGCRRGDVAERLRAEQARPPRRHRAPSGLRTRDRPRLRPRSHREPLRRRLLLRHRARPVCPRPGAPADRRVCLSLRACRLRLARLARLGGLRRTAAERDARRDPALRRACGRRGVVARAGRRTVAVVGTRDRRESRDRLLGDRPHERGRRRRRSARRPVSVAPRADRRLRGGPRRRLSDQGAVRGRPGRDRALRARLVAPDAPGDRTPAARAPPAGHRARARAASVRLLVRLRLEPLRRLPGASGAGLHRLPVRRLGGHAQAGGGVHLGGLQHRADRRCGHPARHRRRVRAARRLRPRARRADRGTGRLPPDGAARVLAQLVEPALPEGSRPRADRRRSSSCRSSSDQDAFGKRSTSSSASSGGSICSDARVETRAGSRRRAATYW